MQGRNIFELEEALVATSRGLPAIQEATCLSILNSIQLTMRAMCSKVAQRLMQTK